MNTQIISKDLARAISLYNGMKPLGKAVAAFFNATSVEADGSQYIVTSPGYDAELLEKIKWDYSVHCAVEERIETAIQQKDDDDFFHGDDEDYQPRDLKSYAVPAFIHSEVKRQASQVEKYEAHLAKDDETISKSNHPEKYYSRRRNHLAKRDRHRFELDVLLALAARFNVNLQIVICNL